MPSVFSVVVIAAFAGLLILGSQGPVVTGKVLKPDGSPAGHATVRMFVHPFGQPQLSAAAKADSEGRFKFTLPVPGEQVGTVNFVSEVPGTALGFANLGLSGKDIVIHLGKPTRAVVPLTLPNGKPAKAVMVAPRVLTREEGGGFQWLILPEEVRKGLAVRTDARGRATFPRLPQGFDCEVDVLDDRYARLDHRSRFALANAPVSTSPVIKLQTGAFLSGQVLLNGRPVSGIEVMAQGTGSGGFGSATSDAQGRFRMGRLSPAQYNVGLNLRGKRSEDYTARAQELTLAVGQEKKGLVFKLEKGAIVTGKVRRPDGTPAPNIPIGIYGPARPRSGGWVQSAATDSAGVYRHRVPAGEQFVYVQLGESQENRSLTVKDGESAQVDFQLKTNPEPTTLRGQVRDPEGKPVAGAIVQAIPQGSRMAFRAQAETDGEGRFTLAVPGEAENYHLEARKGDLYASGQAPDADGDTEIRAARVGLASIAGRVQDAKGKPVAAAQVVVYQWSGGTGRSVSSVQTNAQGGYRFDELLPGREYSLSVTAAGFGRKSESKRYWPKERETMNVPTIGLFAANQPLSGRVVDEKGKPMAGVEVTASLEDVSTTTDREGRFKFDKLPAGKALILAMKGDMYVSRSLATGGVAYELVLKRPARGGDTPANVQTIAAGDVAPELDATEWVNGQAVSLASLKGQIVVLDFWAIWCGPCREELPKVRAMAAQFPREKVTVIGMHDASTWPKELKAFAAKNKMTYLLGIDRKVDQHGFGLTAGRYGVQGIPTVVVIDREGKVASVSHDAETAQATVTRLLKD